MKIIATITLLLSFVFTTFMQDKSTKNTPENHKEKWVKIKHSLSIKKPKTALNLCKEFYKELQKGNYPQEETKCLLYIRSLEVSLEDDRDHLNEDLLFKLNQDIKNSEGVSSNLLNIFAYQLLSNYKTSAYRNVTKNNTVDEKDIKTWTKEFIDDKLKTYRKGYLKNIDDLKNSPQNEYSLLVAFKQNEYYYLENLYQVFLHKDISYQQTNVLNSGLVSVKQWEKALKTNKSDNKELQELLDTYDRFNASFDNIKLKNRFLMEKWNWITNVKNTNSIKEIYLNKLNTLQEKYPKNKEIALRKAILIKAKGDAINYGSVKIKKAIDELKKQKSDYYTNALQIVNTVLVEKDFDKLDGKIVEQVKSVKSIIESESFSLKGESRYLSDRAIILKLTAQNKETLNLEIFKLNREEFGKKIEKNKTFNNLRITDFIKKEKIKDYSIKIENSNPLIEETRDIILPKLKFGIYAVRVKGREDFIAFQVSDIKLFEENKIWKVVNAKNNCIIKDATFYNGFSTDDKKESFDKNGLLKLKDKDRYSFMIKSGKDILTFFRNYKWNNKIHKGRNTKYTNYKENVFTDRAIYRPGQQVEVKVQRLSKTNTEKLYGIAPQEKIVVELRDVMWKILERREILLNDYGTANLTFTLPTDILNGKFTIKTNHGITYIQVEEYKQPGFYVETKFTEEEKVLGDKITIPIHAKTFSGVALNDAKVQYSISYQDMPIHFWYWRCYNYWRPATLFSTGELVLDKNGETNLVIDTKKIPLAIREKNILNFKVNLKVVDKTGATEEENLSFKLANNSLWITSKLPNLIVENNTLKASVNLKNYGNKNVDKNIEYTIWSLETPEELFIGNNKLYNGKAYIDKEVSVQKDLPNYIFNDEGNLASLKKIEIIKTGTIKSNLVSELATIKKQGNYLVEFKTKDKKGKQIKEENYFKVAPKKGKLKKHLASIKIQTNKNTFEINEELKMQFILPYKSKYRLELRSQNAVVWTGCSKGEEVFKGSYKIKETDRGGLSLYVFTVYNGKNYLVNKFISVPFTNKKLKTKWIHFTDKTKPQQKEEWKLEIKDWKGKTPETEVLAFMYDASLDELRKHNIQNKLYKYPTFNARFPLGELGYYLSGYNHVSKSAPYRGYSAFNFMDANRSNWDNYLRNLQISRERYYDVLESESEYLSLEAEPISGIRNTPRKMKFAPSASMDMEASAESDDALANTNNNDEKPKRKAFKIRKNFQETVFFYPELVSDKNGQITIPFTTTDKVGKFKLMVYGHTKGLAQFYVEEEIQSNKELMIELHKPKFLYSGDKIDFSAKVSNISDKDFDTKVRLEVYNKLTDEMLYSSASRKTAIITKGNSITEKFAYQIPKDFVGELKCVFITESDNYTDVEQSAITVLSNVKRLNEQFAFTIPANGSKEYNLKDLLNNTESFTKFRLESLSSPLWQVVKSLPYAKSSDDRILTNLLDELLTIEIGQKILKENPTLATKLEAYILSKPKSTLKEKEEYKNITLEESPWVLEADNQEKEIEQLADFFKLNKLEARKKAIWRKLPAFQKHNGGLTWIKGSKYESLGMNLYAAEMISLVQKINPKAGSASSNFLKKVIMYADAEILKWYNKEKSDPKKYSYYPYNYMQYRIDFQDIVPIKNHVSAMHGYYLNKLINRWNKTSFSTTINTWEIALKHGKQKIAQAIYTSINEYRLENSNQQTIYWKELANGLSWNNRKFVQQAKLVELYKEMGNDKDAVLIQNWLIQQKRSTHWNSSTETAKIVFSLVHKNKRTNLFSNNKVQLFINNKPTDWATGEFFSWDSKTFENNKGIDLETAKVRFNNQADYPVWISLYHQYWSQIDNVKAEKDPNCFITKELYKQVLKDGNEIWEKLPANQVKLGDRLKVKLTFDFQQQLDYVVLEDYFAGCTETKDKTSGWQYQRGGSFYRNIKDQKMQFFFDKIARGKYNFEYQVNVTQVGEFTNGFAQFQSFYAPEFGSHSEGSKLSSAK